MHGTPSTRPSSPTMSADMTAPLPTAGTLDADLSRHTPMMQQYSEESR